MKTKNIINIALSALLFVGTLSSCVNDNDYDTPQVVEEDTDISNGTLSGVQDALNQQFTVGDPSTLVYTFPANSPLVIPAYVIGDDTAGNFYKKLIVQDSPANPTGGLEIMIDQGSLHTTYNVGRKIYIKMAGLTVTYIDGQQGGAPGYINQSDPTDGIAGVYKIGILGEDFQLNRIPATTYQNYIVRSSTTETIIPTIISTTNFDDAHMNTFVQIDNTQVELGDLELTYAGESYDSYDATRVLLNCDSDTQFGLMTSTFSNFKSLVIPQGKGTLKAVLMKDYRERNVVTVLNTPDDVDFTGTDRCDPIILDCGLAATAGTTDLLVENFDAGIPATWTNYIQEGTRNWVDYSGSSALSGSSVKIGSYLSGDASTISWLISPAIDMDAQNNETLEFFTSNSYSDDSNLELLFSNDWDGTEAGIATATWGLLPAATIVDDAEYYQNWVSSGIVDLSCATGSSFYIAFKYTGSGDSTLDGTYELDNFSVKF